MIKYNKTILFFVAFSTIFLLGTGVVYACNMPSSCASTMNNPTGGECSASAFDDKLVGQESGGSYTIGAGTSSALGRYQFIDGTRNSIGQKYGLCGTDSSGGRSTFSGCPALQDEYYRALKQENISLTSSACSSYCGQTRDGIEVTHSGLTAMAHNVGSVCANLWAKGGRSLMYAKGPTFKGVPAGTPPCTDANGTDPIAKYAGAMGGYDVGNGAPAGGCSPMTPTVPNPVSFQNSGLIGCDPSIKEAGATKVQALRQQETEAAKALITKPTSVQQLGCFDQYAKSNAEQVGKIHSNPPAGISDSIAPIVEQSNMQYIIKNFMTNVMGGGLQSMLNGAMSQLTGGLTGGLSGGTSGCQAMDEMWKLLQCMDFPQMPSLSDILGGGGELGGMLSSLGGSGGLGSIMSGLGGGGGGVMGAVCQAVKGAMGGGGSGGTSAYEDLASQLKSTDEEDDSSSDTETSNDECNYALVAASTTNMDADLNSNNIVELFEVRLIDETYGNGNCAINESEITNARANYGQ